jgi:GTP1/Obg family GTP-binding protein
LGLLKADLAQLEAEAHKLEAKGVDEIYTCELPAGVQAEAKQIKKAMLARLEKLFESMDATFRSIRALEVALSKVTASVGTTRCSAAGVSVVEPSLPEACVT